MNSSCKKGVNRQSDGQTRVKTIGPQAENRGPKRGE